MEEPKTDIPTEPEVNIEPPDEIKAQLSPDDHPEPQPLPDHVANQPLPRTEQLILPPKSRRQAYIISGIVLLLIAMAATAYLLSKNK